MSWYVIQVRYGHEVEIAEKCLNLISKELILDCFIPKYICQKKIKGSWQDVKTILFHGYIFIITDKIELLDVELNKVYGFTKIIGKKNAEIYPLDIEEVNLLQSFCDSRHTVEMSVGYIEGEHVYVLKGPLQGKEGLIKKIDRHKRIAYLQLNMLKKEIITKVGLEIISKC